MAPSKQSDGNLYDAIVVGAGLMGLSTGYHLAKAGKKVLLIDQIRYAHTSPIYLPLAIDAYKRWDEISALAGVQLYKSHGLLWPGSIEGTQRRAHVLRQFKVPHEVFNNEQITDRFPHLHYGKEWAALYDPKAGTIFPDKVLPALKKLYLQNGGVIHENEEVLRIDPVSSDRIDVYTIKGNYSAKRLVVAAGAWLKHLIPDLPITVSPVAVSVNFWNVDPTKLQYFQPDNGCPVMIITDLCEELYAIPSVDYPDKFKFGYHFGVPIDPRTKRPEHPDWQHTIPGRHIRDHIPWVDSSAPNIKDGCLYTLTPDQDFILDRHPKFSNIVIGGGFSGTGFKFGSTVGYILSSMALDEKVPFDLTPFKLDARRNDAKGGKL
ncbi:Protein C15B12.1 [Aphelenchoides avenae]|nr:Protein C15B12.1 [Aphelenchus avenae]